jgi:hypothetical protein
MQTLWEVLLVAPQAQSPTNTVRRAQVYRYGDLTYQGLSVLFLSVVHQVLEQLFLVDILILVVLLFLFVVFAVLLLVLGLSGLAHIQLLLPMLQRIAETAVRIRFFLLGFVGLLLFILSTAGRSRVLLISAVLVIRGVLNIVAGLLFVLLFLGLALLIVFAHLDILGGLADIVL